MENSYTRWLEIKDEERAKQKRLKERMAKLRQTKEYQTPKVATKPQTKWVA